MKFRVIFVYWALLFTSVVSSGLLFLIVASESTEDRTGIENDGNLYMFDNFTTNDENEKYEIPEITIAQVRSPAVENEFLEESATKVTSSFDTVNTLDDRVENDLEIMAESIIQQPNLSQGCFEIELKVPRTRTLRTTTILDISIAASQYRKVDKTSFDSCRYSISHTMDTDIFLTEITKNYSYLRENDCRNNNENSTRDHLIAVLLDISEYQIVGELGPVTNQDKAGYKTKKQEDITEHYYRTSAMNYTFPASRAHFSIKFE
ncbi:SUN domain-containing ossification factor isoform X2 [Vespula maculifrons]|uniref:SUN domain-containing ossification factor isoform X2 n=1 Tax=Vespula maculifrons TaxID=7453 RepID=A0ABD2CY17_VESMC